MVQRYSSLFRNYKEVYSEGAPVIVKAMALLKDNETNNLVGQIKFKSICSRAIKAVFVQLNLQDAAFEYQGEVIHEYLDLKINRDDEFGSDEAIIISQINVRNYTVQIKKVVFDDNSIWTNNSEKIYTIPQSHKLNEELSNLAIEEYKIRFGNNMQYIPIKLPYIWVCSCGVINIESEIKCHSCHNVYDELCKGVNDEILTNKAKERHYNNAISLLHSQKTIAAYEKAINELKKCSDYKDSNELIKNYNEEINNIIIIEKYESAISMIKSNDIEFIEKGISILDDINWKDSKEIIFNARKRIECIKAQNKKARKRIIVKIISIIIAGFICVFTTYKIRNYINVLNQYNNAVESYNSGCYLDAIQAFELIADFKNAEEFIYASKYNIAIQYYNIGEYDSALVAFEEISDYKDSSNIINIIKYNQANLFYNDGLYEKASEIFRLLGDFQDSQEMLKECLNEQFELTLNERENNGSITNNSEKLIYKIKRSSENEYTYTVNGDAVVVDFSDWEDEEEYKILTLTITPKNNGTSKINLIVGKIDYTYNISVDIPEEKKDIDVSNNETSSLDKKEGTTYRCYHNELHVQLTDTYSLPVYAYSDDGSPVHVVVEVLEGKDLISASLGEWISDQIVLVNLKAIKNGRACIHVYIQECYEGLGHTKSADCISYIHVSGK